jgi:predicted AAA+ superfamily ATPase
LIGVTLHAKGSFPVGKVELISMYPLNFGEFLLAMHEDKLAVLRDSMDFKLIKVFKDRFITLLKTYFYVGGMPEVVHRFSEDNDFESVPILQQQLLTGYIKDFSKHVPFADIPKLSMLWESIPVQLAKENKKFIYKEVRQGGRAKIYENALTWLINGGLIHKVNRISKPAIPMRSYEEESAFKLFFLDIGLLSAMSKLDVKSLLNGQALFSEFKGALTEQFVLQELKTVPDLAIAYWANDAGTSEIDFLLQSCGDVIPLEVKASINLKARSLKVYEEKFAPRIAIRSSLCDYKKTNNLYDIPLYTISTFAAALPSA